MKFLVLEEVDSTNTYVAQHAAELDDLTMVIATRQTAGRGQRGNSWESEPGKNLTFTLLKQSPRVAPVLQFAISEAVALAVADTLLDPGIDARVKWPNDIYVGDRKISGILIEHALMGSQIEHTRIGVGLNVNQKQFVSDAPNPVSIVQLTGTETKIDDIAKSIGRHIERRLEQAETEQGRIDLHAEFKQSLWRADGYYPFREKESGEIFDARIADVSPTGPMTLALTSGLTKTYNFKEVEFLL